MTIGTNKITGDKKFRFIEKRIDEKHLFLLPTIITKKKAIYNHEIEVKSIMIAWLRFIIQFNFCEVLKDVSLEVKQADLVKIAQLLSAINFKVENKAEFLDFLNKNPNILILLKNGKANHVYVQQIVLMLLSNTSVVTPK